MYRFRSFVPVLLLMFAVARPALAQLKSDGQADAALKSARKSFSEKNYPVAITRFRAFLSKYSGHQAVNEARFGLALSMIEASSKDRNDQEVQQLLAPLAEEKTFSEQGVAACHLAFLFRGQGLEELARGAAAPMEMPRRREAAKNRFEQAAIYFARALPLIQAKAMQPGDKELSPDWELAARVRCDLAEMLVRLNRTKEALATAEPFLKDPTLTRSRAKDLGRFLFAHSAFLLNEMTTAQKILTTLVPIVGSEFGPHARYLLARTHHLADDRGDAQYHYEGCISDHKSRLAATAKLLKDPQLYKSAPAKRAELEASLKQPAPDHVARAEFYLGVLHYEAGRFGEAKACFQNFAKLSPQSPMKVEADLRVGFCQVHLRQYGEAIKTLTPIANHESLADRAYLWIAKAQIGQAPDPATKFQEYRNAVGEAIDTLRTAQARARRLPDSPDARIRAGEILLEIADQSQNIKEARQAIDAYQSLLKSNLLPEREEEILPRLAHAWHLANDFDESDACCRMFFRKFPRSTLSSAVAFTFAENSYFRTAALEKASPSPERNKRLSALYDESLKRLHVASEKYPEHPKNLRVRYLMGLTYYSREEFEKARLAWEGIPVPERSGELRLTPYLLADCVLRHLPPTLPADADALVTGKMDEQLKTATELLSAFVGAHPKDANAPDALLKLGLCQQRRAGMLGDPKAQKATLAGARAAYEKFLSAFPKDPLAPNAVFERARVLAQQGELGTATNELRRFMGEPFSEAAIAPMAAASLATLLRAQNKPVEAADVILKSREAHQSALGKDPKRANWLVLLRFHQAAALREAGKLPEARELFEHIVKQAPRSVEGVESALRIGQTLKEEGLLRLEAGKKLLGESKKDARGQDAVDEGYKFIGDAVAHLEKAADQFKDVEGSQELRARMLYDAAWGERILAEPEVRNAKFSVRDEPIKKPGADAAKAAPPDVALDQVPLQPHEKKVRRLYQDLIDQFDDLALALDARFELAELHSQRNEFDLALKWLHEILDKEPNVDLTEKVRLRLGFIHAAKGNHKTALAQFDAVARNPKSLHLGWAQCCAAEVCLQVKDYPEAIKRLAKFRENSANLKEPGLSDRAMFRLGQAYSMERAWSESYKAFDHCARIAPNGRWIDEARFGMGWAAQQQKKFDEAVTFYKQVVGRTSMDLAAQAQFQIGVCRLEQKRWPDAAAAFAVVSKDYRNTEWSPAALLGAAQAYHEAKDREQSVRLLERVIQEYANTVFAETAKERLEMK